MLDLADRPASHRSCRPPHSGAITEPRGRTGTPRRPGVAWSKLSHVDFLGRRPRGPIRLKARLAQPAGTCPRRSLLPGFAGSPSAVSCTRHRPRPAGIPGPPIASPGRREPTCTGHRSPRNRHGLVVAATPLGSRLVRPHRPATPSRPHPLPTRPSHGLRAITSPRRTRLRRNRPVPARPRPARHHQPTETASHLATASPARSPPARRHQPADTVAGAAAASPPAQVTPPARHHRLADSVSGVTPPTRPLGSRRLRGITGVADTVSGVAAADPGRPPTSRRHRPTKTVSAKPPPARPLGSGPSARHRRGQPITFGRGTTSTFGRTGKASLNPQDTWACGGRLSSTMVLARHCLRVPACRAAPARLHRLWRNAASPSGSPAASTTLASRRRVRAAGLSRLGISRSIGTGPAGDVSCAACGCSLRRSVTCSAPGFWSDRVAAWGRVAGCDRCWGERTAAYV